MKLTLFGDREKAGVVIAALLLLFIGTPGEVWAAEKGEWQKVPLLSGEGGSGREAGGEGCQWPQALAVGEADANLMFYGTNTGGLYRSVNGGQSWELSMKGFYARGCNAFAIDPCNDRQILAIGSSDKEKSYQGIYRSWDRGKSWELVLILPGFVSGANKECLVYDISSFQENAGRCLKAYYSTPAAADTLPKEGRGLYRTLDGGKTWKLVNSGVQGAKLMIHPEKGDLYAAKADGLYVSRDMGESFFPLYQGLLNGCDISFVSGKIYLCREKELLEGEIEEEGKWTPLPEQDFLKEGHTKQIAVSPLNPRKLLLHVEGDENKYRDDIYYSHDGGKSFQKAVYDSSKDFFPYFNPRDKMFAWSNTVEDRVWSFGGDFIISSHDGGKNWRWDSAGVCGVLVGGKLRFNMENPRLMFLGFQDYNGALTTDGGKTWRYIDMSGKGYSGHVYGGYAASQKVFWGCLADSWYEPRHITISFDGGKSFQDTGKVISERISNPDVSSYQSVNDKNVFFAGDYRSGDGGKSWEKMKGCLQVYSHNPKGSHELYGCEEGAGYVVVSYDEGKSWSRVNKSEIPIYDKGYLNEIQPDVENGLLYVAADRKKLYTVELSTGEVHDLTGTLPRDQMGSVYVNGIAVDAEKGRIYVAGYDVAVNRSITILCSDDGGKSWKDASSHGDIAFGDGVISPMCLSIQPESGELWCATSCYGILKLTS